MRGFNMHNGEVSDFSAIRGQSNTVIYRGTDTRTLADEQLGGFGQDIIDQRDTKGVRATAPYNCRIATPLKGGFEWSRNNNFRNTTYIDDALTWSFAPALSGLTGTQLAAPAFSTRRFNPNYGQRLQRPDQHDQRAAEPRRSSTRSTTRTGTAPSPRPSSGPRLTFTTRRTRTAAAPSYARNFETAGRSAGPRAPTALSFFVQDQFSFNRFTVNVGLRGRAVEALRHAPATNIFTFDWEIAPRLSADLRPARRRPAEGVRRSAAATTIRSATT